MDDSDPCRGEAVDRTMDVVDDQAEAHCRNEEEVDRVVGVRHSVVDDPDGHADAYSVVEAVGTADDRVDHAVVAVVVDIVDGVVADDDCEDRWVGNDGVADWVDMADAFRYVEVASVAYCQDMDHTVHDYHQQDSVA